jgi:hypothetical protein
MNIDTVIDISWLESATYEDLKSAMRIPAKLAEVNALLRTPEGQEISADMISDPDYVPKSKRVPDPEEAAQIAADLALAEQQAADALAAEAVVVPVVPEPVVAPVEEKKKIVVNYQATAEDGTPIGRPTHIEGWSNEEVIEKMKNAHINAVRYAERVKKNKVSSIESNSQQVRAQQQVKDLETEAAAAVTEAAKDPEKLPDAIRKVTKAEREAQIATETARQHGKAIADAWMTDHKEDFQPCEANSKIIGNWLQANTLGLTYENLELAFAATETQLAKPMYQAPVEEVSAPVASNAHAVAPVAPAPVTPSITAPVVVAAEPTSMPVTQPVQPVVAAPVSPSAAAPIAQPAARRPGVNGSLPPGTLTAARPVLQQQPVVSTQAELLKEINKMPRDEYRRKIKTREFVERLEAAGIPVVGTRNY